MFRITKVNKKFFWETRKQLESKLINDDAPVRSFMMTEIRLKNVFELSFFLKNMTCIFSLELLWNMRDNPR